MVENKQGCDLDKLTIIIVNADPSVKAHNTQSNYLYAYMISVCTSTYIVIHHVQFNYPHAYNYVPVHICITNTFIIWSV